MLKLITIVLGLLPFYFSLANENTQRYLDLVTSHQADICLYEPNYIKKVDSLLKSGNTQLTDIEKFILVSGKVYFTTCSGDYFFYPERDKNITHELSEMYSDELAKDLWHTSHSYLIHQFIWNYSYYYAGDDNNSACKFLRSQSEILDSNYDKYLALFSTEYCNSTDLFEKLQSILILDRNSPNDRHFKAYLYDYLAISYRTLGLNLLALEAAEKSLMYKTSIVDKHTNYYLLASIHLLLGNYQQAKSYEALFENTHPVLKQSKEYEIDLLLLKAAKYETLKDNHNLYITMMKLKPNLNLLRQFYGSYKYDLMLGKTCLLEEDIECASFVFQYLSTSQNQITENEKSAFYEFLALYYLAENKVSDAQHFLNLYTEEKTSIELDKQNSRFASNVVKLQNDLQEKELEITRGNLTNTRYILLFASICFGLILTLLFLIWQQRNKHKTLSETDELTRIYNRRATIEHVDVLAKNSDLNALVLFDVDHFKLINDTYSHIIGDKALLHIVKVVKQHIRQNDIFGRIGGEEFVLCLRDIEQEKATLKVEAIRKSLAETPLITEAGDKITITASFSMSFNMDKKSKFENYYIELDKYLYKAKHSGRNRVEIINT